MKILITGGAGFIASHIVDAYIQKGHEVVVIDNLSSGKKSNINQKATFHQLDINDDQVSKIITDFKPEIINHHAAQINVRVSVDDPKLDAKQNILGIINLLEAARHAKSVKRIIFSSTGGAMYGDTDLIPTTEKHPAQPISPYGVSKRSSELYLYYYHQVHSLPYTVLRYSNVYGPRQNAHGEAGVVAIFFQQYLDGKTFKINGDGEQTRDFVYVLDVVKANMLATNSNKTGIFNISTSTETSVNDLTKKMQTTINLSEELARGPAIKGEVSRSCLSYQLAKDQLSWNPEFSLDQGLKQTAEYFTKRS